ncbi:hypothetical protein ACHAWT_007409 [Skeletonema menzelii]
MQIASTQSKQIKTCCAEDDIVLPYLCKVDARPMQGLCKAYARPKARGRGKREGIEGWILSYFSLLFFAREWEL